ncbi:MAG TPA: TlpA disulfide reductase family protein [Methylomirabilota bacterium]|nr:TlpA disulfide reductase family protein [Methylomirabilota bacterium]
MAAWATWCVDCRQEMPALEALHRRFGTRGLAVVGINTREGPAVGGVTPVTWA